MLVGDGFEPLVTLFARCGNVCGNVLEPRVGLRSVPVLHTLGNVDYVTRIECYCRFAPLLIPATTRHANQNLVCTVVNVPVVAAARFESHVAVALHGGFSGGEIFGLQWCEIAVAGEELGVAHIRITLRKLALQRQPLGIKR